MNSRFTLIDKKMLKPTALLLVLGTIASFARADWSFEVTNLAGNTESVTVAGPRTCVCLKNTQTYKLKNTNAGTMKIFSTADCTGSYGVISKGSTVTNAQWVNSASVGQDGVPSGGPYNCDP
ncbi:hypothetical protein FBU30_005844 [Linnemannia zychae]|nr:hypothetical protein FBU30_005844 [Linnemannia zychae]